ncbi:MAG: amidohydrolase family protein, partial [Bacillota bacterium]
GVSMLGNTPRVDSLELLDAHFAGALPTGIRQITGIGAPNPPWPKKARVWIGNNYREYEIHPEDAFGQTEAAVKRWKDRHPRAMTYVMPARVGAAPENGRELNIRQNREMRRIANEHGVPIHSHAFAGDMKFVMATSPEVLGSDISLSHCTGMDEEEWQIMADKGISVCHGPSTHSNIRVRCPAVEMLEAGVNVVIATDGTAPDRSFDLWRDMRMAQILHRCHFHDSGLLPPGLILEMCTIRAAKALKLDHQIGSLEVGKKADMILVDVEQPHLAPFGAMPIQRLVYHASGQDVSHVIIDGQLIMADRQVLSVDQRRILADASNACTTMMERSGNWDKTVNTKLYEISSH